MSQGFVLDIPMDMLNRIDDADSKIEKLATTSEQAKDRIVRAFQQMSDDGVMAFINGLNQAQQSLNNLGRGTIDQMFKGVSNSATQGADAVNRMTESISKATEHRGMNLSNNAIAKINVQIEEAIKQLAILKQQMDIRASTGADISAYQQEYASRQARLQELEQEKTKLQEIAQLRVNEAVQLDKRAATDAKNSASWNQQMQQRKEEERKAEADRAAFYERWIKQVDARIKAEERADEAAKKRAERQRKADEKAERDRIKRPDELINLRGTMQSMQQLQNYARDLKRTMDTLSPKSSEWKQLNTIYGETRQRIKEIKNEMEGTKGKMNGLLNTTEQLKRAFALMFSVSAIKNYVNKLIQVRGEFELQRRSLEVLLQSKEKADTLWQQTVDLALKSPLGVKQLITYTKQLAAYRVESHKLFETTKMLADVSAGLGVDMQRLILAYGQVKAANYLRGTELRQFSEAGVNMLEELSKYFTETEGHMVSVGEVFSRISKRMVGFRDVEEVFKRITSEGGVFFDMQAKQADTLRGRMLNLRDAIDLMLDSIGADNQGTLNSLVSMMRSMVENWRAWLAILKAVVAVGLAVTLAKVVSALKLTGLALTEAAMAGTGLRGVVASLKLAVADLYKVIIANPWVALATAIVGAVYALYEYNKAVDAQNKKYDDASANEIRRSNTLKGYVEKIEEQNNIINELSKSNEKNEESEHKLKLAREENQKILNTIKNDYPEIYDSIKKNTNGTLDMANAVEEHNKQLRINIALQQDAKGNWFQDSLGENYKDLMDSKDVLTKKIVELNSEAIKLKVTLESLKFVGDIDEDAYNRALAVLNKVESASTYEEMHKAFAFYEDTSFKGFGMTLRNGFANMRAKYLSTGDDFMSVLSDYNNQLRAFYANLENQMYAYYVKYYELWAENPKKAKESWAAWLDEALQHLGIADKEIRKFAKEYVAKQLKIEVVFTDDKKTKTYTEKDLTEEWQKKVWRMINAVKATNPQITIPIKLADLVESDKDTIFTKLRELLPDFAKLNNQMADAGKFAGQLWQTPEQIQQAKKAKPILKDFMNLVAIGEKGKKKDTEKERLTNQIRLIKEMNKEYEKLRNLMTDEEATNKIRSAYADSAKEYNLDISKSTFDIKGTISSLNGLLTVTPERLHKELKKATDNLKAEVDLEARKTSLEGLKQQFEKMFADVSLSKELQEIGFSKDAMGRFGVKFTNLEEVRNTLTTRKSEFDSYGKKGEEAYEKLLDKLQKLEDKAIIERTKKYYQYLFEGQRDYIKIIMEQTAKLDEIDKSALSQNAKYLAKERVQQATAKQLDSIRWKDFKETNMYSMMFEDLEYYGTKALENLKKKIEDLKKSLVDLPANEMKDIVTQLNKIYDITLTRKPFESLKTINSAISKFTMSEDAAYDEIQRQEVIISENQKLLDVIDSINLSQETKKKIDEDIIKHAKQGLQIDELDSKVLAKKRTTVAENLADAKKELTIALGVANAYKQQKQARIAALNRTNDLLGEVNNAVKASMELMEALGVSSDSIAGILANSISSMISLTMSAIQFQIQLQAMGVAANSALGIIGWVAIAIQAIATALAAAFKAKDKALVNQIEELAKKAEKAQEAFEKLTGEINEIYTSEKMKETNKELEKYNKNLLDYYRQMKMLQEERKRTDEVAKEIEELDKKIKEAEEDLVDAQENIVSHATGGILDSVFDTAKGLVEAWADAYKEVGNGMNGLEENFEEMLMNMAKQQAAIQIVGIFTERWKKELEKYVNTDDLKLTKEEAAAWAQEVRETFPELNAALEGYLGAILDNVGGGSLSGLEEGIGSMSEETAEVIAAYLNSLRYFVAENNATIKQLRDYVIGNDEQANPMLAQLRIIAAQTTSIRSLLDSVAKGGHSEGGMGLKVFIN